MKTDLNWEQFRFQLFTMDGTIQEFRNYLQRREVKLLWSTNNQRLKGLVEELLFDRSFGDKAADQVKCLLEVYDGKITNRAISICLGSGFSTSLKWLIAQGYDISQGGKPQSLVRYLTVTSHSMQQPDKEVLKFLQSKISAKQMKKDLPKNRKKKDNTKYCRI